MLDGEIKSLLEKQGEAFDAFKKSNDEQLTELKKGVNDPVLKDRISKIEFLVYGLILTMLGKLALNMLQLKQRDKE